MTAMFDKQAVARSFGRAAASYDSQASMQRQVVDALVADLPRGLQAPEVLDLGSGTGYDAMLLAESYPDAALTCCDIAHPMLLLARQRPLPAACAYVCGDAENLPLRDAAYDLLVSSLTIQWCQDYPALFRELARVVKPGGRLYLTTLGPPTLQELRAAWQRVDSHVHVNRFAAMEELRGAWRAAGLEALRSEERPLIRDYADLRQLTCELKGIGAHNVNSGQPGSLTGKSKMRRLREEFESGRLPGRGVPVTWQIITLVLQRPFGRHDA